jgi:hypothetical protein
VSASVLRRLDAWLFGEEAGRRLWVCTTGLAAVMAVRIALGPYRQLADQPAALFRPVPFLRLLPAMPPLWVIVSLQAVGVVAAVLATAGWRRSGTFALAWTCLLVLAGLRGSLGKILHNDVLLLLAAVPFLAAPAVARWDRTRSARYGWPVRTALVVVAGGYFFAGLAKLRFSGLAWVTGDNMRFILYDGARGGRAPSPSIALFVADRAWLAHVVAGALLALELTFPAVLVWPRARPTFAAGAAAVHVGTWLTLGLDYWAWIATVVIVLVDWDALAAATHVLAQPDRALAPPGRAGIGPP